MWKLLTRVHGEGDLQSPVLPNKDDACVSVGYNTNSTWLVTSVGGPNPTPRS